MGPLFLGAEGMAVNHTDVVILDVLQSSRQPLTIEEIVDRIPLLGWNQVFLAVDSMSRKGLIILKRRAYSFLVSCPTHDTTKPEDSMRSLSPPRNEGSASP